MGGGSGYLLSMNFATGELASWIPIFVISGIFIGSLFIWIVCEVIESGTATVFVCLATDPQALQRSKPELFNKFREVYPSVSYV